MSAAGTPGDGLGPLRAELPHVGRQLLKADGPVLHEAPVVQPLLDQHVDHGQGRAPSVPGRTGSHRASRPGPSRCGGGPPPAPGRRGPGPADAGHGQGGEALAGLVPRPPQLGCSRSAKVSSFHTRSAGRGDHPWRRSSCAAPWCSGAKGTAGSGRGLPHAGGDSISRATARKCRGPCYRQTPSAVPTRGLPQPRTTWSSASSQPMRCRLRRAPRPGAALGIQQPLGA